MLVDGPACRLYAEVQGGGEPVTVFAHGLASSSADLRALASFVPGTRVLFDFRGHGRSESPPPGAGYDHPAMREDLDAIIGRFAATRALGVSMGAGAILSLLCEEPDRLARAVVVMLPRIDDPCPDAPGTIGFAEQIEAEPLAGIADALLALPHLQPLLTREPRWRSHIREQIMRVNVAGVPHALRAYATGRPPVADPALLEKVAIPVLVAGHEGDPNHPATVSRRLGDLLPNATVRIWEDDFAMMLDDLDAFGAMAGAFLSAP